MSDGAVVLWLEPGDSGESRARAESALAEWARARGVRLAPIDEAPGSPAVDPTLAERVEKELDRARDAIGAADVDAVERALARAEAILREHPELPQAAWLRAEVERSWSARWLRIEPRDDLRARAAWENAQALDGGRIAGIGEMSFPAPPRLRTSIAVLGPRASGLVLRLDGAVLTSREAGASSATYDVEMAPGEHHLLAMRDGRLRFASWIAIGGPAPTPTSVTITEGGTCTRDDLGGARREGDRVVAEGVTCPQWVTALPGRRPGAVLVARCERDACGPLLEWRAERWAAPGPPQAAPPSLRWPSWATWTLVGIGAATATSIALVATGILETRPVEPRFIVGGARQE